MEDRRWDTEKNDNSQKKKNIDNYFILSIDSQRISMWIELGEKDHGQWYNTSLNIPMIANVRLG
jgi:uncharacterized membrane protein YukC